MKSNSTVGQVLAAWSLGSHVSPTPAVSPASSNNYSLLIPLSLAPQTLPSLFIPSASDGYSLGRFGAECEILRQEMEMLIPVQDWHLAGDSVRVSPLTPNPGPSMSWHGGCHIFEGRLLL